MKRTASTRGAVVYWGVHLAVALAAATACKAVPGQGGGGSNAAPGPGTPLTLTWEQPYKLVATGTEASATFFGTKEADKPRLKLSASFMGFPKGTQVTVGSEQGTIEDNYWSTLVDFQPAVTRKSIEDLKGPVDLGFDVILTPPGAPAAVTKLPKQDLKESIRFALLKARDGGLSFGDGDAAAGKPRGVAVVSGYSDLEFIGSARTLKEVDWIVVADDKKEPRASKTCNFKEGPSTLKIYDADVTVFDRRTGEQRATDVVKASDECPMFALVNKDDNSTKNSAAKDDVVAWARKALAGAGGAEAAKPAEESAKQGRPEAARAPAAEAAKPTVQHAVAQTPAKTAEAAPAKPAPAKPPVAAPKGPAPAKPR